MSAVVERVVTEAGVVALLRTATGPDLKVDPYLRDDARRAAAGMVRDPAELADIAARLGSFVDDIGEALDGAA